MLRDVKYLFGFVWRVDKSGIFFYLCIITLAQAFNSAFPLMLKILIDSVMEQRGLGYMLAAVVIFTAAGFVTNCVTSFLSIVNTRMNHRLEAMFANVFSRKSAEIDMASYDDPEFYNSLKLAFQSGQASAMGSFQMLMNAAGSIAGLVTGLAIAVTLDPIFIVFSIVSASVSVLLGRWANKVVMQYTEESVAHQRRAIYFKEVIYQRETAEDFKQYDGLTSTLTSGFTESLKKRHLMEMRYHLRILGNNLLNTASDIIFSYALPYGYIAVSAFYGRISVADMSVLLSNYNTVRNNFLSFANIGKSLRQFSMYAKHLRGLLEYEPVIEKPGGAELAEIESVEFRGVHFSYPTGDEPVLEGVSFLINRGEKAALVGVNGAGKTTIARLLLRFYDPQEGAILINGRDIREYDVGSLRRQAATVFQNFQSYSLPIAQLISCAGSGTDDERVRACLEQVGLLETVEALPQGIHTEYGKTFDENGAVLSGGQLQKLIIARMLYKGSSLVIMDEPSSALDPESEYQLNRDIARAASDRTVLLISHRLSTTRDADKVILIENGVVSELGSHSELMSRGGRYAQLFTLQASGYINEE